MTALDILPRPGSAFRLSRPSWLRFPRREQPDAARAEEARARRAFILDMMEAHPSAFAHEEDFREMLCCMSRGC